MALEIFLTQSYTVDASDISIFEEDDVSFSDQEYTITCDLSNAFSSLRYQDQESGTTLYSTTDASFNAKLLAGLNTWSLVEASYESTSAPTDSTLGQQYIQFVASKLFGHPGAQAPIENDGVIATRINTEVVNDLYNDLSLSTPADGSGNITPVSHTLFHEIFQNIVDYKPARLTADDATTPQALFAAGDSVSLKLTITGKSVVLGSDSISTSTVWKLKLLA